MNNDFSFFDSVIIEALKVTGVIVGRWDSPYSKTRYHVRYVAAGDRRIIDWFNADELVLLDVASLSGNPRSEPPLGGI